MKLPKYKKKKRIKLKICHEPGCAKEFWGHPISKYCELHKNIKDRVKPIKKIELVTTKNLIMRHMYASPTDVKLMCCLEGCKSKYTIKLFPKQEVYPKFCPEHRNDFRRDNFIRFMKINKVTAN